jgi:hypothetical protein
MSLENNIRGAEAESMVGYPQAILGSAMCVADRVYAKAAFVYRYTKDWTPQWVEYADDKPAVQFADDEDWLAHTYFAVDNNDRMLRPAEKSHSTPTWPDGKPEHWEQSEFKMGADEDSAGELI